MPALIETIEVFADTDRVDFAGLDGNTDFVYRIDMLLRHAISGDVRIEINGDTSFGDYTYRHGELRGGTGATNEDANDHARISIADVGDYLDGTFLLFAPSVLDGINRVRHWQLNSIFVDVSAGTLDTKVIYGSYQQLGGNVATITFKSDTGNNMIGAGSYFRLFRYPLV